MWTHLSIFVHALFGLALAVGKNVCLDPIESAGIRGGFELVHLLEVDHETVEFRAGERIHSVQVRENHFTGLCIVGRAGLRVERAKAERGGWLKKEGVRKRS